MENKLDLVCNYTFDTDYGQSFNELAKKVFGIDFTSWYEKGLWDERYRCYSYINSGRVVANVSVNLMNLIIEGEEKKVIQLGTVMTDPDFRGKGLSGSLMNFVLNKYEREVDFVFLFANSSVLRFYPKFGFSAQQEYQFILDTRPFIQTYTNGVRTLQPKKLQRDFDFIQEMYAKKKTNKKLDIKNGEGLLGFYCLSIFADHVYYIQPLHTVVIYKIEDSILHLYSVIRTHNFSFKQLFKYIANEQVERVIFHFTPDFDDITPKKELIDGNQDVLFIKGKTCKLFPEPFYFPITGHS